MGFLQHLVAYLALAGLATAASVRRSSNTCVCRNIPGDAAWPSPREWSALNKTVSGRLIATIPRAAPCHSNLFGSTQRNPLFNTDECDSLRDDWFNPLTHLNYPSSPMAYQFSNNSCNPFLDPSVACTIGYLVAYTIDARSAADIQAAIQFVQQHNIRLVIRNTGHDYLGKSTGAHALAVWVHNMKDISLINRWSDNTYVGPAIQMGAGIEGLEAYKFANTKGLTVVGGNCPNVGIAGGYTQGGGIGILSSKHGMAADQVLEYQVVTGTGQLLTANAAKNSDLFWALRGGGGGTYGVVVSMTVKAFPDSTFSAAYLTVPKTAANQDAFYASLGTFLQSLPALVDAGAWAVYVDTPGVFLVSPAMVAGLSPAQLDAFLKPFTDKLTSNGVDFIYSSAQYPNFLAAYGSMQLSWDVANDNLGGRLMPRDVVSTNQSTQAVVDAIRHVGTQTTISGVAFSVAKGVKSPDDVAVNPYFRKVLFSTVLGTAINYTDFATNKGRQDQITNDFLPRFKALTPNGAAYLNEGDFQEPDFKTTFYGAHYSKLLSIKNKYDPKDIFYAKTAVGSDRWAQKLDGRLCTV
ncbi:FAD binding domain-containing protein [Xylariaceae sp. FL1651]|nr:FAD binding domain-containing protein [Xylariaceae sp. FL1651]